MPINQSARDGANVKAGDRVNVTLQLDEEPRVVKVPPDFARVLKANPIVKAKWNKLSYTHRKEYVHAIEEAKKPEMRARRTEKAIEQLTADKQSDA